MEEEKITLENLIQQGKQILSGLTLKNGYFETYSLQNREEFEEWQNITLRFIASSFPDDFQNNKLESLFNSFCAGQIHSPIVLEKILGVINGYKTLPQTIKPKSIDGNIGTQVNINNNNTNSNTQTQSVNIFIDAIKDDLTGKQVKELKEIVSQESDDLEKAKPKILEKVISWGGNVAAGIVTNLITNPSIWGGL
ncbi:MAG: hypothetical protein SNI05_08225 [Rikenellaceae bacterium]